MTVACGKRCLLSHLMMAVLIPTAYSLPSLHSIFPVAHQPHAHACYHGASFIHQEVRHVISPAAVKVNDVLLRQTISSRPSATSCFPTTRLFMSSPSPLPSSSQRTSPSPWSPGKWKVTLDFGREGVVESEYSSSETNENNLQLSNLLGEEWGAEGGRLVLSFEILANAETDTTKVDEQQSIQMKWLGGKPTGAVETMLNDEGYSSASYINTKGQQNVQISSGQWRIEPPLPLLPTFANILPGQASTLRLYLTLLDAIERNTITLPENQLLLLQSNTFRYQQYMNGVQTILPYAYEKERSQKILEEQLNHETGDRRLDGNDILETLGGYKDIAELALDRDAKRRRWKDIEGDLPKLDDASIDTTSGRRIDINDLVDEDDRWGIWPGDTELMTIERGVILAVVREEKKKKGGGGFSFPWMQDGGNGPEPVIVGKWSVVPLEED